MEEAKRSLRIDSKPPDSIGRSRASTAQGPDSQRFVDAQSATSEAPATAFWFGEATRPLFGWYHAATDPARAAVVLCNGLGHEALVLHRTYRRLAQYLAAKGFATLRFDYDGTGDSSGSDEDPARVEAWIGGIRQAVDEVVSLSGQREVILIGTRVGALLAAQAAARAPVAGLALIAPPRSGRAWLREARAMQAIKDSSLGPVDSVGPELGLAGFLVDEAARGDLSQINLRELSAPPARIAFVVARDDLPNGEAELAQHLNELGTKTELCLAPGYAASMPEDPFKAVVPMQVFDALGHWLEAAFPAPAPSESTIAEGSAESGTNLVPFKTTMQSDTTIREAVVDIAGLFGILTEPTRSEARQRTAVALLNIGANHHIGSNRMYVNMARTWAARGFEVLRMDFSGMGDSRLRSSGKENDVYASRFMAEARSGVDFLIDRGASNVVLMGLCSGAYVAYHTATADPRVSGIVLVNPLTFHWTEGDSLEVRMRQSFGSTAQYKRRFFKYETWRRLLRGEIGVAAISAELARRIRRRATYEARSVMARLTGDIAETTDIESGFRRMCARGTSSLLVLGADDGSRDAIEEHLGKDAAAMRSVSGFQMEIWQGTDHTFTPLWAQRKLIQRIGDYLATNHGNR